MAISIVRHRVNDYAQWREAFDAFAPIREAGGERSAIVVQEESDPNDVTVIETWPSLEMAKRFIGSSELRSAMDHAGVVGAPVVLYGSDS